MTLDFMAHPKNGGDGREKRRRERRIYVVAALPLTPLETVTKVVNMTPDGKITKDSIPITADDKYVEIKEVSPFALPDVEKWEVYYRAKMTRLFPERTIDYAYVAEWEKKHGVIWGNPPKKAVIAGEYTYLELARDIAKYLNERIAAAAKKKDAKT